MYSFSPYFFFNVSFLATIRPILVRKQIVRPRPSEEEIKKYQKCLLENEDKWWAFDKDYLASYGIDAPEDLF